MLSPSIEPSVNQNLAIEPIRGLKCPISLDSMTSPVYLKGCDHIFEKNVIQDAFNQCFKENNTATCPMCNRLYSIAKILPSFETRAEAINRFFSKILIVPVVSNEINGLLEKRKNKINQLSAQNEQLTKYFEQFSQKVEQLENKIITLQQNLNETNALLRTAIEEKQNLEKEKNETFEKLVNVSSEKDRAIKEKDDAIKEINEAIKEKDEAIKQKDEAIKEKNSTYNHLKITYSASTIIVITAVAVSIINIKK